jgi:tetratricopeptide (TPR) repeat protein
MIAYRAVLRIVGASMLVGGLAVHAAQPAFAQDNKARAAALDVQARKAFAEGSFADAAQHFRDAYEAVPHPSTKYNEGMAWDKANDGPRAADAYAQALASSGLDDARTTAARERLAELERTLAILSISAPEGGTASVAHVRDGLIPLRIHLTPGGYDVRVRELDGRTVVRKVEAPAGKVVELVVEVTTVEAPERPDESGPRPEPKEVSVDTSGGSSSTWGWVALGGAGAFSLGAGYLGLRTLSSLDDYEASGYRDADARDETKRFKTWTNVAWGAAALSGTVGVVLLLTDGGSKEPDTQARASAHVRLAPGAILAGCTF